MARGAKRAELSVQSEDHMGYLADVLEAPLAMPRGLMLALLKKQTPVPFAVILGSAAQFFQHCTDAENIAVDYFVITALRRLQCMMYS